MKFNFISKNKERWDNEQLKLPKGVMTTVKSIDQLYTNVKDFFSLPSTFSRFMKK